MLFPQSVAVPVAVVLTSTPYVRSMIISGKLFPDTSSILTPCKLISMQATFSARYTSGSKSVPECPMIFSSLITKRSSRI